MIIAHEEATSSRKRHFLLFDHPSAWASLRHQHKFLDHSFLNHWVIFNVVCAVSCMKHNQTQEWLIYVSKSRWPQKWPALYVENCFVYFKEKGMSKSFKIYKVCLIAVNHVFGFFISLSKHERLRVSYCDLPLSVVCCQLLLQTTSSHEPLQGFEIVLHEATMN